MLHNTTKLTLSQMHESVEISFALDQSKIHQNGKYYLVLNSYNK